MKCIVYANAPGQPPHILFEVPVETGSIIIPPKLLHEDVEIEIDFQEEG